MSENISKIQVAEAISKLNSHFNIHLPVEEFKSQEYSRSSICDILIQKVMDEVSGEWTADIAFRKIRSTVAKTLKKSAESITTETLLDELIPSEGRKETLKAMSEDIGVPLDVLKPNSKIYGTLIFLFFACIPFAIGMDWFVSGIAMVVILILIYVLGKTGNQFKMKTVGQMADVIAWKNYLQQQRGNSTVSEDEIRKKVMEII
jgi:hypothetical protein